MRLCAILLLLTSIAPLSAAERLSDEEVLAKMDDASASEARWILSATKFATGAIGMGGSTTRATAAWRRLVRQGSSEPFEALLQSSRDHAVCFAVTALGKLDPTKVVAELPRLVTLRETIVEQGGCTIAQTSPALEALRAIVGLNDNKNMVSLPLAWEAWLGAVLSQGARPFDDLIARNFIELLGETPPMRDSLELKRYVLAARLERLPSSDWPESPEFLVDLAAQDEACVSRTLAIQLLATRHDPYRRPAFFESIWRRHWTESDTTALCVAAQYWQMELRIVSDRILADEGVASVPDATFWHDLTNRDWDWLCELEDSNAHGAANLLKANPICNWQVDQEEPGERIARSIWLLHLAKTAGSHHDREAERAAIVLSTTLAEDMADTSIVLQAKLGGSFPAVQFSDADLERVLDAALAAIESTNTSASSKALKFLLSFVVAWEPAREILIEREDFPEIHETLRKTCDEFRGPEKWDLRFALLQFADAAWDVERILEGWYVKAVHRWFDELAKTLGLAPRNMPPAVDYYRLQSLAYRYDCRSAAFVRGLVSGEVDEFLPDADIPSRPTSEERPDASEIYKRMQEAAAKLGD